MKIPFIALFLLIAPGLFAQKKMTISWQQRLDLPQDTYVRLMHSADSLLKAYEYEPFQFERKDGSCCEHGLKVVRSFYQKALEEMPEDEAATHGVEVINNYLQDEKLLLEEDDYVIIMNKADLYFRDGYYERAIVLYRRALDLNPTSKPLKKKLKHAKKEQRKHASS